MCCFALAQQPLEYLDCAFSSSVRLAVSRGILLDELGVNIDTEALKTSLPGKRKKLDLPPPPISSAN